MARPLRIANASGFYGDLLAAPRIMLDGPEPVDVLTGDYLAELTMLILHKARSRAPEAGYATTFLAQMEEVLGTCLERGVRVVANAGGLNPHGLAEQLRRIGREIGREPAIGVVDGDDLMPRLAEIRASGEPLINLDTGEPFDAARAEALSANAYLGGFGIAACLDAGAEIVISGRVADAAMVIGPAASHHGWGPEDLDQLAGAVVAGHVIECGTQATGGNYCFVDELPDHRFPGFPIAEVAEDGSSVITKQPGSGGIVSVGTVTAQLLYEIGDERYLNPDVTTCFETIEISQAGVDRVAIGTPRGLPAPPSSKVAINYEGGWRNQMSVVLTGLDLEAKAARVEAMAFDLLGGREQFDGVDVSLIGPGPTDPTSDAEAAGKLRIAVRSKDRALVDRSFSRAIVELTLASVPGYFTDSPPSGATAYGVYWPALIDRSHVTQVATLPDGTRIEIPHCPAAEVAPAVPAELPDPPAGPPGVAIELGRLLGARSGDKGGNANVGVWAEDDQVYAWAANALDEAAIAQLLPEAGGLEIRRTLLPRLRAINFVIVGLLGEGVASCLRFDPQAKGLGEHLRSRVVEVPASVAARARPSASAQ